MRTFIRKIYPFIAKNAISVFVPKRIFSNKRKGEEMKDRLIELLEAEGGFPRYMTDDERRAKLADYLLENGVIVPLVRLGQACFKPCDYLNKVDECRVSSITQKADGTFKIRFTNLRGKWVFEMVEECIGKHIFLTMEEAEQALRKEDEGK